MTEKWTGTPEVLSTPVSSLKGKTVAGLDVEFAESGTLR